MFFYMYILQSEKSGRYYIGHTGNLDERIATHNSGKVKSTRNKGPWQVLYFEKFNTKIEANRRELEVKRQKSRSYIENLILNKRE